MSKMIEIDDIDEIIDEVISSRDEEKTMVDNFHQKRCEVEGIVVYFRNYGEYYRAIIIPLSFFNDLPPASYEKSVPSTEGTTDGVYLCKKATLDVIASINMQGALKSDYVLPATHWDKKKAPEPGLMRKGVIFPVKLERCKEKAYDGFLNGMQINNNDNAGLVSNQHDDSIQDENGKEYVPCTCARCKHKNIVLALSHRLNPLPERSREGNFFTCEAGVFTNKKSVENLETEIFCDKFEPES